MNHYCTHSDKNYVAKGIAMCKSIIEHDKNAVIWYLFLDDETFEKVDKIENIIPVSIAQLEAFDSKIAELKNCKPSNYGTSYSQYCWALTPCFIWYLMNIQNGLRPDKLIYCDADLYFYKHPQLISEACKNHSVGIHTHRFSSYDPETNDVGEFNVGCVYFKKDEAGLKVSEFWKNCMLNPENEYAKKYGTCGDQKYLDLFIPLFGKETVCVFDRDTAPVIYHAAPWNFGNYEYRGNEIYFNNEKIELTFNHFSHFNASNDGNWKSSNNGEWAPENTHETVRKFYNNYNKKVNENNI